MGIFSRLLKPVGKLYHSSYVNTIVHHYSTILTSPNLLLNPNTIIKSLLTPYNHQSLINPTQIIAHTFNKSIHTARSANTQIKHDQNNQTPDIKIPQITIEEAEKICKLLSNVRDLKTVDSVLTQVSVNSSSILVELVLKKLSNAGLLGLTFFRWAEKKKGFNPTPECYNALIEALGKIKQFKMVWILIDEMKRKKLLVKDSFHLVTRRYARARKVNEAISAFEKMEKYGLNLELDDYNRLIDTLSKSRHVERAHQVFDKWKNNKFKPNIKTYTILLEGWGGEQNLLKLDEVRREMRAVGFKPDVVTYGIIIHAYCKAKKIDKAIETYHEMKRENINGTPHVYCTLINGLGSDKRLTEALEFFELAKTCGYPLEAPTYNAVIGAYCWSARMHDAYKILDEMKKRGVGPNARTYDIILHRLVKDGRRKEAYSVFQNMECERTLSTYEIMVRMFCNEERTDMAIRVWNEMKGKGVIPGMHMFSTLINSLCHEDKYDDACRYFEEMMDMGIRPPSTMFSSLKQNLLDQGKNDMVLKLAHKFEKLMKTQVTF